MSAAAPAAQEWIVITTQGGLAYWCSTSAASEEEAIANVKPNVFEEHAFVGGFPHGFGAAAGWAWHLDRPLFDERSLELVQAWKRQTRAAPGPRKPAPQVPPEVWNTRPVSAEGAMAAVRAMCGGST